MNQDKKIYVILFIIGIIPTIWLALIIAPLLEGGLTSIVNELPSALKSPFNISICDSSRNTVLFFLLAYIVGIGAYISNKKNYRKGEEHGSAKWGNAKEINKKYKQKPDKENRILTQNVKMGLNAKKHRRNLNVLVVGRKSEQEKHYFMQNQTYYKPQIIRI